MNQEEFDNKLGDSFKNEHLPPDKRLWENISARLDEDKKKPFYLWLLPIIIAVVAVSSWLFSTIGVQTKTASHVANNAKASYAENQVDSDKHSNSTSLAKSAEINESTNQNGANSPIVSAGYFENNADKLGDNNLNNTKRVGTNNGTSLTNPNENIQYNQASTNLANNNWGQKNDLPAIIPTIIDFNDITLAKRKFSKPNLAKFELPEEKEVISDLKAKKGKVIRSNYTSQPVDFDSKWWWSVGAGPQISGNSAVIKNDSIAYIHKDLWANKDKMTHSGTGFHAQFLLGHRFGQHFSIESGLQYNLHTEDIRFNITSYSVETRDQSDNKITAYQDNLILWIHLVGSTDSTFYFATRNFSLATKNRYQIITVPIKFNFEQNITPNTKLVAGLGAGISAITSKSVTHLNLINDGYIKEKKSTQFTTCFSTQLGIYTNINDIGQLGFYTNFRMYSKPWELANKQYAIRMNDLQFGISFRRPLNWRQ